MSIDILYDKRYDARTYNCVDFAADAWELITGNSIADIMGGGRNRITNGVSVRTRHHWRKIANPSSVCLVLMRRRGVDPHVGVFYNNRVLHIRERGVQYQPLCAVTAGYTRTEFYHVK